MKKLHLWEILPDSLNKIVIDLKEEFIEEKEYQ